MTCVATIDGNFDLPTGLFQSDFQGKSIDLEKFYLFLLDKVDGSVIERAKDRRGYKVTKKSIIDIANGIDVWDKGTEDHKELRKEHRKLYLLHFGAIPSTSLWVERAVKKAKLCQSAGKGERTVTAYCIAADGIDEKCDSQIVQTSYPEKMTKKRKAQQEKAQASGKEARSKDDFEEDVSRGPSLTRNLVNHALKLRMSIDRMKKDDMVGENEYNARFDRTKNMLSSLEKQGSYACYQVLTEEFENFCDEEYIPTARGREG